VARVGVLSLVFSPRLRGLFADRDPAVIVRPILAVSKWVAMTRIDPEAVILTAPTLARSIAIDRLAPRTID